MITIMRMSTNPAIAQPMAKARVISVEGGRKSASANLKINKKEFKIN